MSTPDVLSKLQALLERVRARSHAHGLPRVEVGGVDAQRPVLEARRSEANRPAPEAARSGPQPTRAAVEAARSGPQPTRAAAETARFTSEAVRSAPDAGVVPGRRVATRPEPPRPAAERVEKIDAVAMPPAAAEPVDASTWTPAPPAGEPEIVIDVEETEPVRATLQEGGEIVDSPARTSESDERLRAAQAATPEPESEAEPEAEVARSSLPSDLPGVEEASLSASNAELEPQEPTRAVEALAEEEERAPASSRRPVALAAEDHLAHIAFGADESSIPHHTPPPESGRLPSATADEFDDATGIRGARVEETGRKVISHLAAESTRAILERSDVVADAIGETRRFTPATFLALLEASLEL